MCVVHMHRHGLAKQASHCGPNHDAQVVSTGETEAAEHALEGAEASAAAAGQALRFGPHGGVAARGQLPQLMRVALGVQQAQLVRTLRPVQYACRDCFETDNIRAVAYEVELMSLAEQHRPHVAREALLFR